MTSRTRDSFHNSDTTRARLALEDSERLQELIAKRWTALDPQGRSVLEQLARESKATTARRYEELAAIAGEHGDDQSSTLLSAMAEFGHRTLATDDPFELITTAVTGERFIREHSRRFYGKQIPVSKIETALNLAGEGPPGATG